MASSTPPVADTAPAPAAEAPTPQAPASNAVAPDSTVAPAATTPGTPAEEPIDKRILGILPNYRTVQDTGHVQPITAKRKLWIASKDSFDYPIWFTAAIFAGVYQLQDSNPEFGEGVKGYLKRYGASFADQCIGNMMTEGIMPSILHEDPRYYRRGTGNGWHRLGYALTRIFVTHTDAGTVRFNFSELIGNSIAVSFSNVYYSQTRDAKDNAEKLAFQLMTDSLSNALKEFWPDAKRKFIHRHAADSASAAQIQ